MTNKERRAWNKRVAEIQAEIDAYYGFGTQRPTLLRRIRAAIAAAKG